MWKIRNERKEMNEVGRRDTTVEVVVVYSKQTLRYSRVLSWLRTRKEWADAGLAEVGKTPAWNDK